MKAYEPFALGDLPRAVRLVRLDLTGPVTNFFVHDVATMLSAVCNVAQLLQQVEARGTLCLSNEGCAKLGEAARGRWWHVAGAVRSRQAPCVGGWAGQ